MQIRNIIRRGARYIIKGVPDIRVNASITTIASSGLLKDKRIVVTGGGSGLGSAIAQKLVNDGAQVLITGRNEKKLAEIAEKIRCRYIVLDMTHVEKFAGFIDNATGILGGTIDALINNAGISLHENSFFDVSPDSFDRQINTNFRGPFFLSQAYISYLLARKSEGRIIMISSETGETVDCRPYGYTKAAINSMVKGLAHLFKEEKIRINAIAPGVTATDMTGVARDGNYYAGHYGEGRYYLPEEIAEIAAFLLSPAANCISGQIIACNNAQTVNARWK